MRTHRGGELTHERIFALFLAFHFLCFCFCLCFSDDPSRVDRRGHRRSGGHGVESRSRLFDRPVSIPAHAALRARMVVLSTHLKAVSGTVAWQLRGTRLIGPCLGVALIAPTPLVSIRLTPRSITCALLFRIWLAATQNRVLFIFHSQFFCSTSQRQVARVGFGKCSAWTR